MIAQLKGILEEKSTGSVLIDVQGVGYEALIPLSTYASLPEPGEAVKLLIHTSMREDGWTLFGFHTPEEKSLFSLLTGVTGIGPKLGLAALSGLAAEDLARAIAHEDVGRIATISGIGKKTAQRIAMELKDKIPSVGGAVSLGAAKSVAGGASPGDLSMREEVFSALLNLGYKRVHVEQAVAEAFADGVERMEDGLKLALKALST